MKYSMGEWATTLQGISPTTDRDCRVLPYRLCLGLRSRTRGYHLIFESVNRFLEGVDLRIICDLCHVKVRLEVCVLLFQLLASGQYLADYCAQVHCMHAIARHQDYSTSTQALRFTALKGIAISPNALLGWHEGEDGSAWLVPKGILALRMVRHPVMVHGRFIHSEEGFYDSTLFEYAFVLIHFAFNLG